MDYQKLFPEKVNFSFEEQFCEFYSKILPVLRKKFVSLQAKEWLENLSDPIITEGNLEYKILFKMFI
jgi:hypothetical protein